MRLLAPLLAGLLTAYCLPAETLEVFGFVYAADGTAGSAVSAPAHAKACAWVLGSGQAGYDPAGLTRTAQYCYYAFDANPASGWSAGDIVTVLVEARPGREGWDGPAQCGAVRHTVTAEEKSFSTVSLEPVTLSAVPVVTVVAQAAGDVRLRWQAMSLPEAPTSYSVYRATFSQPMLGYEEAQALGMVAWPNAGVADFSDAGAEAGSGYWYALAPNFASGAVGTGARPDQAYYTAFGQSPAQFVWVPGSCSPTPSATGTATDTVSPTPSGTATHSPSPTGSATPTASATPTQTATFSHTSTSSPTATGTATVSSSATASSTPTVSATPSSSDTASVTPSVTPTSSPTDTGTATPTPSATPTPTATCSATSTPSPTDTGTTTPSGTVSPSSTASATPTASGTSTATSTVSPGPSATATPSASATPTRLATFSATVSPSAGLRAAKLLAGPVPARRGQAVCVGYPRPPAWTELALYNAAGDRVAKLGRAAGPACLATDGLAPGVYFMRIKAEYVDGSTERATVRVAVTR